MNIQEIEEYVMISSRTVRDVYYSIVNGQSSRGKDFAVVVTQTFLNKLYIYQKLIVNPDNKNCLASISIDDLSTLSEIIDDDLREKEKKNIFKKCSRFIKLLFIVWILNLNLEIVLEEERQFNTTYLDIGTGVLLAGAHLILNDYKS